MKKIRAVLFAAMLIGLIPELGAADLYGIIFADTEAQNIACPTACDCQRMYAGMASLAEDIHYTFKPIVLRGDDLYEEAIIRTIAELEVEGDDIVFFYFSGHGQRPFDFPDDPWPLMTFYFRKGCCLNFTDLTMKLLEKDPRLVIALADCCNMELPVAPNVQIRLSESGGNAERGRRSKMTAIDNNLTEFGKMLLDTTGLVMLSSSSPGEYSWACPSGGIYTIYFLKSLEQEREEECPGFAEMFERVLQDVSNYGQHPQYLMIPSGDEALMTLRSLRAE